MPELPEVETIVRGLAESIQGAKIARTRVFRSDLLRVSPRVFRGGLAGRSVVGVARRAKSILISLDSGAVLVVHLGMTGQLLLGADPDHPPHATHAGVVFSLADGRRLVYDDVRRFGVLEVLAPEDWAVREARIGPEPLEDDFTAPVFREALRSSRSPIRSWLLDQRRIAGVGNIYAIEALHRARIHPQQATRTISVPEADALRREIRRVLRAAIRQRGTTLRNYRDADGNQGGNAPRLLAYGRAGQPCRRCGDTITRIVFGNRSAFLCPTCQPRSGAAF
jgi:formamidopyrimidine-DNA glycosylase